jgi:hypothetical protein
MGTAWLNPGPRYTKNPCRRRFFAFGWVGTNWIRRGATEVAAQGEMMPENRQEGSYSCLS